MGRLHIFGIISILWLGCTPESPHENGFSTIDTSQIIEEFFVDHFSVPQDSNRVVFLGQWKPFASNITVDFDSVLFDRIQRRCQANGFDLLQHSRGTKPWGMSMLRESDSGRIGSYELLTNLTRTAEDTISIELHSSGGSMSYILAHRRF